MAAHDGVNRKNSLLPYVSHCFDVAKCLSRWGVDRERLIIAALLHDTVEDTHVRIEDLAALFGDDVATIIGYVTWPDDVKTQRDKFDHLSEWAGSADPSNDLVHDALVLKMADRACNVVDYYDHDRPYAARYLLTGFPAFAGYLDRFTAHPDSVVKVETFQHTLGWLEQMVADNFQPKGRAPRPDLRWLWKLLKPDQIRAILWPPKKEGPAGPSS